MPSTDPEVTTDAALGVDAEASTDSDEEPDLCVLLPSQTNYPNIYNAFSKYKGGDIIHRRCMQCASHF